jgi:hypothetical protein
VPKDDTPTTIEVSAWQLLLCSSFCCRRYHNVVFTDDGSDDDRDFYCKRYAKSRATRDAGRREREAEAA